jgi:hypothetical protein
MRMVIGYIDIFITMKTQINEELNLIKYLFDYKKGKVISEQNGSLLTEADGKTKEEYPACVQNLGDVVTGGGGSSAITDKQGNSYFNNNRAQLQPGVPGNPDTINIKMVDYFCASDGTVKFGKPDPKELLLINAKKCGWGTDVKAYEASGWKCDSKMDVASIVKDTAVNIQNKLVSLGKDIGPKGVDGKLGAKSMLAIWEVLKTVK